MWFFRYNLIKLYAKTEHKGKLRFLEASEPGEPGEERDIIKHKDLIKLIHLGKVG